MTGAKRREGPGIIVGVLVAAVVLAWLWPVPRATHVLLMITRPGLDRLLGEASVRPGRPYAEPGNRHLPRQTHQHLLATFARGTLTPGPKNT